AVATVLARLLRRVLIEDDTRPGAASGRVAGRTADDTQQESQVAHGTLRRGCRLCIHVRQRGNRCFRKPAQLPCMKSECQRSCEARASSFLRRPATFSWM